MNVVILLIIIIGMLAQNVTRKSYNKKTDGGACMFSALSCVAAILCFIFTAGGKLDFNLSYLPYSIGFALSYGSATVFSFLALACGSLALTSLIVAYSLIVPSLAGILFLDEPTGLFLYIGFIFLIVSIKTAKIQEINFIL